MRFEWDGEKNRINQQKHGGIAFESAALVFNDPKQSSARIASWPANSGGTPLEP